MKAQLKDVFISMNKKEIKEMAKACCGMMAEETLDQKEKTFTVAEMWKITRNKKSVLLK